MWKNTGQSYGKISISLHWVMALILIGLYILGDYMVDLDYYDPWYHDSLSTHKAIGIIAGLLLITRFLWNHLQIKPAPLDPENTLQNLLAKGGHILLYVLMFIMIISGYLISTAKGQGIDVFGLFEIPALLADNADRGELAGEIHEIAATVFIIMVGLHVLAALLHHYLFKDKTLLRMLRTSDSDQH